MKEYIETLKWFEKFYDKNKKLKNNLMEALIEFAKELE